MEKIRKGMRPLLLAKEADDPIGISVYIIGRAGVFATACGIGLTGGFCMIRLRHTTAVPARWGLLSGFACFQTVAAIEAATDVEIFLFKNRVY